MGVTSEAETRVCVTSHRKESENGLIVEMIKRDKKKTTGWIFIIIGWLYTHTANMYLTSNNL